ncbi:hypothetical protein AB0C69_24075 [Actinomadura sp. NPDC048032]|uniref:hypothetical protein n=1 Tax=Actinomadura sp. NPDC048032 TaxID=3155747 RepID=UPI0033C49696
MSTKIAVAGTGHGPSPLRRRAATALLIAMFLQGVGGALTTGSVPLAAATLIVLGGTPLLFGYTSFAYRRYGRSMFSMGTFGQEETTIFKTLRRGGFTVDAAALRWVFVGVIGLTSLGINIGIAEADSIIGTGPRTAVQTLGTLLAGVLTFVVWQPRRWNQVVLRFMLFGSIVFAVALFSNGGNIETRGLVWAGVVGLHMFMVQKALTAFGTEAFEDDKVNKELSQRYRDVGMTLANCITLGLIVPWALLNHSFPTPDKFAGALLPVPALYALIPLCVMFLPVLLMNWARNHLQETEQAMLSSTAPIAGAFAALLLSFIGWASTPSLDGGQWVGMWMVFGAALAAGIDVAVHAKLDQKDTELAYVWGQLTEANTRITGLITEAGQANDRCAEATRLYQEADTKVRETEANLRAADAERQRLQAELDARNAEAQPPAANGAKSVKYSEVTGLVGTRDGIRFQRAGGLTVESDGVVIETKGVQEASVGNDGSFTGGRVDSGVVRCDGREFRFLGGEAVQADPDGNYRIERVAYGDSIGALSAE